MDYGLRMAVADNGRSRGNSVAKRFPLTESVALQFRAEAFNLFNHANLGQPNGCVDCQGQGAGLITSTVSSQDGTSMRRMRFALQRCR